MSDSLSGPYRLGARVEKWNPGQDHTSEPPAEVVETRSWYEADGTEITDPARLAQLNAAFAQEES